MSTDFIKFPRTPHLVWLGARPPRDDKVLDPSQARDFLNGPIVVEEKVDGTNLGISLDREGSCRLKVAENLLSQGGIPNLVHFGNGWRSTTKLLVPRLEVD